MSETFIAPNLTRAVAIDIAQPVFRGHFPETPILPGVFIIHFMRKLIAESHPESVPSGKSLRASKIRFLKPVRPGDILELLAIVKTRSGLAGISNQGPWETRATVSGETVFTGQFMQEAIGA